MESILIIDDEDDIINILSYNLKNEGYTVYAANSGQEGIELAKEKRPDLIVLDVMMPEMDGIEVCERLRSSDDTKDTRICFLTARSEDYSQIAGFDAGADDYVAKPVKPKVLMSRIKALLRRERNDDSSTQQSNSKQIVIDRDRYVVIKGSTEIRLPRKEFELLALLASAPEKVFEREIIMEKVWGSDVIVGDRTIDVHIRKLREKIGGDHIQTIKGVGYSFREL